MWLVRVNYLIDRATNEWSEWIAPDIGAGFGEGFAQDKTFDKCETVQFRVKQTAEPEIELFTWANVAHFTDTVGTLTYDSDGLPVNHNQYIVKNIEKSYNLGVWTIKLYLEEPTCWLEKQAITTLSYTNQTSKSVVEGETTVEYTKDPYTVLTKLERMLKVTPLNQDNLDFQYQEGKSLFSRIKILDSTFLDTVPFSDDTDSAGDVFSVLNKLEGVIDRTPVLYFDMTLTGEYEMPKIQLLSGQPYILYEDVEILKADNPVGGLTPHYPDISFSKTTGFTLSGTAVTYFGDLIVGKTYYIGNSGAVNAYTLFKVTETDTSWIYTKMWQSFITSVATTTHPANLVNPTYLLKFLRRDGYDKTELDYDTITAGSISLGITESGDNYATGIRSEVSKMATGIPIVFPAEGLFIAPEYDSDDRTITEVTEETKGTQQGKWFIELPFPIKKIIEIKKLRLEGYYQEYSASSANILLERENSTIDSKYVLEEQNYKASSLYSTDFTSLFHYTEGDTKLYINEYYYNIEDETFIFGEVLRPKSETAIYNIEYEPLIDTVIENGTNELVESVNQQDSQVENSKYSKWLNDYLNSSNGSDITFAKIHSHYNEIYPIGSRVIKDDEEYLITRVAYTCLNLKLKAVYQLNKDYMRRNYNVSANQQIRPSRSIEYNNLKDRKNILKKVIELGIEFSTTPYGDPCIVYTVSADSDYIGLRLISALYSNTDIGELELLVPKVATIETNSFINKTETGLVNYSKEFLWAFAKQINGNQIQLNFKFKNNAEIATQKIPHIYYDTTSYVERSDFYDIQYQNSILYTNPFGEVDKISISFKNINVEGYDDYEIYDQYLTSSDEAIEYFNTQKMYNTMAQLPIVSEDLTAIQTNVFNVNNINLYKDMLEEFNVSVVFELKTSNNVIACKDLFAYSKFFVDYNSNGLKAFFFSVKKNEFDDLTTGLIASKDLGVTHISDTSMRNWWSGSSYSTAKSVVITTSLVGGEYKKLLIINK